MEEVPELHIPVTSLLKEAQAVSLEHLDDKQQILLAKTLSRLTTWTEDLTHSAVALSASSFSTALLLEEVDKTTKSLSEFKASIKDVIEDQHADQKSSVPFDTAFQDYNLAVHRLISLRNPPFDEGTVEYLKELDDFLPSFLEQEAAALQASDPVGLPQDPSKSIEDTEEFVTVEGLPEGSKLIYSPQGESGASTPIEQQIAPWKSQILQHTYASAMTAIKSHTPLPISRPEVLTNARSSGRYIDMVLRISKKHLNPIATKVFTLCINHLQRLDAAMARVAVKSLDICADEPSNILWGIYTDLLKAAEYNVSTMKAASKILEMIVQNMPQMRLFSEMCGPFEQYELSKQVIELFESVVCYGMRALKALQQLSENQSRTSDFIPLDILEDLGGLSKSIRYKALDVEKAALKERLATSIDIETTPTASATWRKETDIENMSSKDDDEVSYNTDSGDEDIKDASSVGEADISESELHQLLMKMEDSPPISSSGPKSIHDAPESLLTHFRGRRDKLESLVNATYSQFGTYTGHCVLYDPEPMGKTQIILRYVRSLCATSPEISVFWITASSPVAISRSNGQILALLKDRAQKSNSQRYRMLAVKRHLERLDRYYGKSWLLVLDDIQMKALETLKGLLPRNSPRGRIVYTTRSMDIVKFLKSEHGGILIQIDIGRMSEEDASSVLIAESGIKSTENNIKWARDVVKQLDYSPIPIKVVGGLLKRFKDLRKENIMTICREEWEKHEEFEGSASLGAIPMVQAVLRFSLGHIRKRRADVHALLCILAFFDSESIPFGPIANEDFLNDDLVPPGSDRTRSILQRRGSTTLRIDTSDSTGIIDYEKSVAEIETDMKTSSFLFSDIETHLPAPEIISDVLSKLSSRHSRQELVDQLLESSLVGKRSNVARLTLFIHESVRKAIHAEMSEEGSLNEYYYTAVRLLTKALDKLGPSLRGAQTWRKCAILLPHFDSLQRLHPEGAKRDISFFRGLSKLGEYLHASGQYKKAINYFSWSQMGLNPREKREIEEKLARSYQKNDDFNTSDEIFAKLLNRKKDGSITLTLNIKDLQIAEGLASNYYLRGLLCKARNLYLAILERTNQMGQNQVDQYLVAKIHEGLGNTYQRLGEPISAAKHYEYCDAYRKEELSSHTISSLRMRYNKARLLRDRGNLPQAQAAFESILEDYGKSVGREHPDALLVSGRLAYTYAMRGQYEQAEQLALKVLSLQLAKEDRQWVAICYTYWVLAGIYTHTETKTRRKAHAYFLLALEGYEAHLPPGHLFTLYVRRDFSHLFQLQSRLDEAVEVLMEIDPEHIKGTAAAAKLARLYDWQATAAKKSNKIKEWRMKITMAEEIAKKTHDIQRDILGKYHSDFNYTLWVLARIYSNRDDPGDRARAEENYKNAIMGYRRIEGEVFLSRDTLENEYERFKKGHLQSSPTGIMPQHAWLGNLEIPWPMLDDHIDEEYREGGQHNAITNISDSFQSPVVPRDPLYLPFPSDETMWNRPPPTSISA